MLPIVPEAKICGVLLQKEILKCVTILQGIELNVRGVSAGITIAAMLLQSRDSQNCATVTLIIISEFG